MARSCFVGQRWLAWAMGGLIVVVIVVAAGALAIGAADPAHSSAPMALDRRSSASPAARDSPFYDTTTTTNPPIVSSVTVGSQLPSSDVDSSNGDFDSFQDGFANAYDSTRGNEPLLGVAHTTDGGATWTLVAQPTAFRGNPSISGYVFMSPMVGVSWGQPNSEKPASGPNLYRTTDGGHTWNLLPDPQAVNQILRAGTSLWALTGTARPVLWTSTDSGRSWNQAGTLPVGATTIDPLSATDAVTGTPSATEQTTNGGITWHPTGTQAPCITPTDSSEAVVDIDPILAAYSTTTLWYICGSEPGAGSEEKDVWYSSDSGAQWALEADSRVGRRPVGNFPVGGYHFDGAYFPLNNHTLLVNLGRQGVLISEDDGRTWSDPIPGDGQDRGDASSLQQVVSGGFIAFEDNSRWMSSNGIRWTTATS